MSTRPPFRIVALLMSLAGVVSSPVHAGEPPLPRGLEMMRRTERAFARATGEIGVRNGFLMFFSDDCIAPPDSTPVRARLLARPVPIEPRPGLLEWEPLIGDISRSTDMGYLSGPASFTDAEGAKHYNVYFSVWRRNGEGLWKVVLDAGMQVAAPSPEFSDGKFRVAAGSAWTDSLPPAVAAAAASDLRATENAFIAAARSDPRRAYTANLADNARLHRDGRDPITNRDSILAFIATQPAMISAHVIKADAAAAGDLGWTFGACEFRTGDKLRHAAFTRVWKRDAKGRWKIVADLLNPAED
jgi:ketosteroid isomerase-like protein